MGKIMSIQDKLEQKAKNVIYPKRRYKSISDMLADDTCPDSVKLKYIKGIANMETVNSLRKGEIHAALQWMFQTFDLSGYMK